MAEEAIKKAAKEVAEITKIIVENLLRDDMPPKKVIQIVSNITLEEIESLEKKLLETV